MITDWYINDYELSQFQYTNVFNCTVGLTGLQVMFLLHFANDFGINPEYIAIT